MFTTGFVSLLKAVVLSDIVFKVIENDIVNIYGSNFYCRAIFIFLDSFIGIIRGSHLRTIISHKLLRRGRSFHYGRFRFFYGGNGNLFASESLGNSHDFTTAKKRLKAFEHFFDCRLETEIQTDCEDKKNGKENVAGKFVSAETGYGGMTTK